MDRWLIIVLVTIAVVILLVVYNPIMTKNSEPMPNKQAPTVDNIGSLIFMSGNTLIFWMRANHQTFTIGGQAFFQIGPNAGGYSDVIYAPADAGRLSQIIGESHCDRSVLTAAFESLTDQSTKEELQTKLSCLGPLVFTPLPFSDD